MIEDTRKRTRWPGTLVWSGASWFKLVKRLGKRFESARRLSVFLSICRGNLEMKEGPDVQPG
jgi:hypothetical protein